MFLEVLLHAAAPLDGQNVIEIHYMRCIAPFTFSLAQASFLLCCFSCRRSASDSKTVTTAQGKSTVKGIVTDPRQSLVSDATVTLAGPKGFHQEVKTNDKGEYVFTGLTEGTYNLTVTSANFETKTLDSINVSAGDEVELEVSLEVALAQQSHAQAAARKPAMYRPASSSCLLKPACSRTAQGKSTVKGTVTDPSQAVVSDATVALTGPNGFHQEVKTNDKGEYVFTGLAEGTYNLMVTAANFGVKTLDSINVAAGDEVMLDISLEVAIAKSDVNVQSTPMRIKLKRRPHQSQARCPRRKLQPTASTDAIFRSSSRWLLA